MLLIINQLMNKYSGFLISPKSAQSSRIFSPPCSRPTSSISTTAKTFMSKPFHFPEETTSFSHQQSIDAQWPEFELPDSADPNTSRYALPINFPIRPTTSQLSGLTLKENQKNHMRSCSMFSFLDGEPMEFNVVGHRRMPSEDQFTKILDKLEMVISNKNLVNQKVPLREGVPVDLLLDEGTIQYFRVRSKGRKSPLWVSIKKTKGKLITFVSRTIPEPSEHLCDQLSKFDNFEISDAGLRFRCDNIYLAIQAIEYSNFSITVGFGLKRQQSLVSSPIEKFESETPINEIQKDESKYQLAERVEKVLCKRRRTALSLSKEKDFVKNNMLISPKDEKKDKITWEEKRLKVLKNKEQIFKEKKDRTIKVLNRQAIRMEREKEEKRLNEIKNALLENQKSWFSLIYFSISLNKFKELRVACRASAFLKLSKTRSIRSIQRAYRSYTNNLDIKTLNTLRASSILKYYFNHTKPLINIPLKSQIVKCIKESAKHHILPYGFTRLYKRIVNIQRAWHMYNAKRKKRWESLIRFWNEMLEILIKESSNKAIRKKKKLLDSNKYAKITLISRNQVLTEYFRNCKRNFHIQLRDYIANTKESVRRGVKAFRMAITKGNEDSPAYITFAPDFKYLPSTEELIKLIEKATKL
ncbi:unnamed protein product [Blepharisma stoltei]|uniref:Uncharacterized protein n=1 Tax=Blepharisma stoltei TaxID=1481888 RepID=A0AAU9JYR5_9CILI|nr:unnamed protein product [Blepharisma stoltei]